MGYPLWSPVSTWSNFVDSGGHEGVRRSMMVGLGRGGQAASACPLFVKIGSAGDIVGCVLPPSGGFPGGPRRMRIVRAGLGVGRRRIRPFAGRRGRRADGLGDRGLECDPSSPSGSPSTTPTANCRLATPRKMWFRYEKRTQNRNLALVKDVLSVHT